MKHTKTVAAKTLLLSLSDEIDLEKPLFMRATSEFV